MLKKLPQQELQRIVDFFSDNYQEAENYLVPGNIEKLIEMYGDYEYFSIDDEYGIEAFCLVKVKYDIVAEVFSVITRLDVRGSGLTRKLSDVVENTLKNNGIKKAIGYISTKNKRSLITAINRGFLVEGLMRNQDGNNSDYYIIGKEL